MKTVVVGHRGTGKTDLIRRMRLYVRDEDSAFVDLDAEIEQKVGKGLRELFLEHGETYFREMERQVFLEILQRPYKELYLVLGAGFDLSVVPESVRVLWVKRRTDHDGRIFLNRPRLEPDLLPLDEFHQRAVPREQRYHDRADEVYYMPEGVFENHHRAMDTEKAILTHHMESVGGALTLLPEMFKTEFRWQNFLNRYKEKNVSFFELRDDLLNAQQIEKALTDLSGERFIFSLRHRPYSEDFFQSEFFKTCVDKSTWVDWAFELGPAEKIFESVPAEKLILSLHDASRFEEWSEAGKKAAHLKFAPEVLTFSELARYDRWQKADRVHRSFLPRSSQGRWMWYRQLQKGQQLINFIREDEGSSLDQPSLWSWLMTPEKPKHFAAVLGDPVYHSFTPLEHSDFFHKMGLPVFAIEIARNEWTEAFPYLQSLGLSYVAVTSPHKENAGYVLGKDHGPVNTLMWSEKKKSWLGASTDEMGFLELIEGIGMIAPIQKEIFVWGGGGTLPMLKKILPQASYYSSRTGAMRENSSEEGLVPKILIWAAPRSSETVLPPDSWKPSMVFDLNYKEDSLGREYAQKCGANYQSGLVMFTAQAQGQRMFWRHAEEPA